MFCENCGDVETIAHLLYECNDSSLVWLKPSNILALKLPGNILLLFFYENLNNIFCSSENCIQHKDIILIHKSASVSA